MLLARDLMRLFRKDVSVVFGTTIPSLPPSTPLQYYFSTL